MNDTTLIEALRNKFKISEAEYAHLDSYYNGEIDPDMNVAMEDSWYKGIDLGNIEAKAALLEFLDSLE